LRNEAGISEPHLFSLLNESGEIDVGRHVLFPQSFVGIFRDSVSEVTQEGSFPTTMRIEFFGEIPVVDGNDKTSRKPTGDPLYPMESLQIHFGSLPLFKDHTHPSEVIRNPRVGKIL
jgi:hypothetical protein